MKRLLCIGLLVSAGVFASAQFTLTTQSSFTRAITFAQPPNDARKFVIEHRNVPVNFSARIRILNGTTITGTFLQLNNISNGGEQGLLSIAFHPNYATNRTFFIYWIDSNMDSVITKYQTSATNPDVADVSTADEILRLPQPFENHNGATMRFGPDGTLWIGFGDGGAGNDPGNRAQNKDVLYGKILRINVDVDEFPADPSKDYGIPADNPFASGPGADEVYHYGLRNPWQWEFDRPEHNGFGGVLIADVGQDLHEEVDYVLSTEKGVNFGWRVFEGFDLTGLTGGDGGPYRAPIYAYDHTPACSISGGTVCRDPRLGTGAWGKYFFTDYCGGFLRWIPLSFDLETGAVVNAPITTFTDNATGVGGGATAVNTANDRKMYTTRVLTSRIQLVGQTNPSRQISGTLSFSNVVGAPPKGVVFEYRDATTHAHIASLQVGIPANGQFVVPAPTGNYEVTVKSATWLRVTLPSNTTSSDVSGLNFALVNGDVDGDNEIGPADFAILSGAFGSSLGGPGYVRPADLDRDDEVGPSDFGVLSANFGLMGDD